MKLNAIPRIEEDGSPILFFNNVEANTGYIACVTIHGHTEASYEYYLKHTRPSNFNSKFYCLGYDKEELKLKKRIDHSMLSSSWGIQ